MANLGLFSATMRRIPSTTFRVVLAYLTDSGVDADAALDGTGVCERDLRLPHATVRPDAYRTLIRNGLRLSGEPHLGLSVGRHSRISDFGLFGYALMSCATLGEAARLGTRYWGTIGAEVTIRTEETAGQVHWILGEAFPLDDLWQFACERWIAAVLGGSRVNTGDRDLPHTIEVDYPEPAHSAMYGKILRRPVAFDMPSTRISLPKDVLTRPNLFGDAGTAELCARQCEAMSAALGEQDEVVAALRDLLVASIGRYPCLDEAARRLGMSGRTLRRRLARAGMSFQTVLDLTRADLATGYLTKTEFTVQETAALLGFSEPTNFSKAFKKWTGLAAGEVRRRR